eukprot:2981802-Prymnesium_polylepis.1
MVKTLARQTVRSSINSGLQLLQQQSDAELQGHLALVGQRVEIHSLEHSTFLNGLQAKVVSFDRPSQRYVVAITLDPSDADAHGGFRISPANLRMVPTPART